MKYYSTNNKSEYADLRKAVLQGLAPDGGLYMPEAVPRLSRDFIKRLHLATQSEIAFEIANSYFQADLSKGALEKIIANSLAFDAPLIKLSDTLFSLELFHGPSLSFKDFGMSFMARLVEFLIRGENRLLHIMAATSGDTGSAVGQSFLQIPGVHVWILYPKARISHVQEKQLTTMGHNVTVLEVEGTFDDCQALVKQAFCDPELQLKRWLTSANSINIGRLIPQIFYYFFGYAQLPEPGREAVFSVPSGNFGNLAAGLLAKKMGLSIKKVIAATNANEIVPHYLQTGLFVPQPSKHTLSNAMDVGNPSNFARLTDLYKGDLQAIRKDVYGCSFTDAQTIAGIKALYQSYSYIADPHGAIAYLGLSEFMQKNPHQEGIMLETAHPAKFMDIVQPALQRPIDMPYSLMQALNKNKKAITIPNSLEALKQLLLAAS